MTGLSFSSTLSGSNGARLVALKLEVMFSTALGRQPVGR
jgi:hypothetical protein